MMLIKVSVSLVVLVAALASHRALGAAVKGRDSQEYSAPAPTKGGSPLEAPKGRLAPAVLERQQQQQQVQRIEFVAEEQQQQQRESAEAPQAKGQPEEPRAAPSKTAARKQPEAPRKQQEEAAAPARKQPEEPRRQPEEQQQQQLIVERTEKTSARAEEKLPAIQQKLVSEETEQQREEAPAGVKSAPPAAAPIRYEAKPQIRDEQQQIQAEQVVERTEQQPLRLEQQRAEQYQEEQQQQQVELRLPQQQQEEQRRLEDDYAPAAPIVQQEEQQQRQEQRQEQTKGGLAEPEPYSFSYAIDGSSRSESGDTKGVVRGQYTLQGADGSRRIVDYIADHNGFRASVNTNEFGTEARSPAGVALRSSQPSAEDITLRLEGKTRIEQQQQQQQQADLASGVKGAPAPTKGQAAPLALPALLPIVQQQSVALEAAAPVAEAPIKSASPTKRVEQIQQEPALLANKKEPVQQPEILRLDESQKSAELRSPKALRLTGESPRKADSRTFESATAHREYRPSASAGYQSRQSAAAVAARPPSQPQRATLLRAAQPVAAAAAYQPRRQLPPPSPVRAAGYTRRQPPVVEASANQNARLSFYSSQSAGATIDEEPASAAGFEASS